MQCKDIPERPILRFLAKYPDGVTWFPGNFENSIENAVPEIVRGTKLVLSKMKQLIKRGLVDGCACGCRGDFTLTKKGEDYLTHLNSCVITKGE